MNFFNVYIKRVFKFLIYLWNQRFDTTMINHIRVEKHVPAVGTNIEVVIMQTIKTV